MKYYNITVNGVAYSVSVEETAAGAAPVAAAPVAAPAAPAAPKAPAAAPAAPAGAAGAVAVKAPMPGNILDVKVKAHNLRQHCYRYGSTGQCAVR